MAYTDAGFNGFVERSIESIPTAANLASLPLYPPRDLSWDNIQVSGSLGNVFQVGNPTNVGTIQDALQASGTIMGGALANATTQGGAVQNLDLKGDLALAGVISVGGVNIKIDGPNRAITINDGTNDIILLGYQANGF